MDITRRTFLGGSLMAAAGCIAGKGPARHRSDYDGIQIGAITYSYRSMPHAPGCTVRHTTGSGLGTIELMGGDLELDVGAPVSGKVPWKLSKAEKEAVTRWRKTADFGRFREVRRRYEDAGVGVHIVKFGSIGTPAMSDWETDYCFRAAQAMGAGAITREIPDVKNISGWKEQAMRLRPYVEKYGIKIAFHNHLQINSKTYDGPLLDWCDGFRINFDIGHYTAANDDDPLEFVKKYHDRILSIHLKDRTTKAHGQKNLAFGAGDTPLGGLFDLLRREGWDFPCDIELEYAIPDGSDAVKEVGICNDFCRNSILG